jgi:hypothetical protein
MFRVPAIGPVHGRLAQPGAARGQAPSLRFVVRSCSIHFLTCCHARHADPKQFGKFDFKFDRTWQLLDKMSIQVCFSFDVFCVGVDSVLVLSFQAEQGQVVGGGQHRGEAHDHAQESLAEREKSTEQMAKQYGMCCCCFCLLCSLGCLFVCFCLQARGRVEAARGRREAAAGGPSNATRRFRNAQGPGSKRGLARFRSHFVAVPFSTLCAFGCRNLKAPAAYHQRLSPPQQHRAAAAAKASHSAHIAEPSAWAPSVCIAALNLPEC